MTDAPLMLRPFSADWASAFRDAVDADAHYREVSTKWIWPMALVLAAAPEFGYDEPVAVELALQHGRCHGAVIRLADAVTAPFVLSASYATWKLVVKGELDPLAGVMRGRIHVKGSLTTLMLHSRSATALCRCAQAIHTHFPDEDPHG